MNERIKELRKKLGLNQTDFGAQIGLSQRGLASIEQGSNVTERNFDAICRAFHVNPEWLRHGVGEMFLESRDEMIQSIVKEFKLTDGEAALIRSFLELEPEHRAGVLKWAEKFIGLMSAQLGVENSKREEISERMTVEQKRAIVNRELDDEEAAIKKAPASSASTTTIGSRKIFGNGS